MSQLDSEADDEADYSVSECEKSNGIMARTHDADSAMDHDSAHNVQHDESVVHEDDHEPISTNDKDDLKGLVHNEIDVSGSGRDSDNVSWSFQPHLDSTATTTESMGFCSCLEHINESDRHTITSTTQMGAWKQNIVWFAYSIIAKFESRSKCCVDVEFWTAKVEKTSLASGDGCG